MRKRAHDKGRELMDMLTSMESNRGNFIRIGQLDPPYEPIAYGLRWLLVLLLLLVIILALSSLDC